MSDQSRIPVDASSAPSQKLTELEMARQAVTTLWQITQQAAQPAQVHIACQQAHETAMRFFEKIEAKDGGSARANGSRS